MSCSGASSCEESEEEPEDVNTELQEAAKGGNLAGVKSLLSKKPGPDINKRDPRTGWTPHIAASVRGHLEVAAFLLDNGADVNASANGEKIGHNSLLAAAGWGHIEIVKLLIEKGADITRVNPQGQNALDRANAANRKESAKFIEGIMKSKGLFNTAKAATPAAAPTAAMADLSVDDGYHIMLSYQWDDQETVKKIAAALKANGLKVWLDIEQMSGSTNEAMAEAVESASAVLVCMSDKYKQSKNCRKEAEYADLGNVPIIPLKMEQGYRPKGWLGIIIGSKLFYDFSGKYPFEEKLNELVTEVKKCKRTD